MVESPLNFQITEKAQSHFVALIEKESMEGLGIRVYVDPPGSPMAEVVICFCSAGEEMFTDLTYPMTGFLLYVDKISLPYLEAATIDFVVDNKLGGQLSIRAPNLRGQKPKEEAPLSEKVLYYINSEINPNLASHGGMVSLVEVNEKNEVLLRFGGGCLGCSMVNVTLKEGIETTLMERLLEVTAVKDVTDHKMAENPYIPK